MKRKKRRLAKTEWNFWRLHEAPPEEQRFAWVWELDRELGSGNRPYLSLSMATRQKVAQSAEVNRTLRTPVQELSLREFVDSMRAHGMPAFDPFPAHLLVFDWEHFTREQILEAVGKWIDSKPDHTLRSGRLAKSKKGRRESYVHHLIDLAILRLSKAGVTQKKGVESLMHTIPNPIPSSLPDPEKFTPSHWSDAKRQAQQAIFTRKNDLFSVASNIGGNWRDYFVRLP